MSSSCHAVKQQSEITNSAKVLVSIIIINYRTPELTAEAVDAVHRVMTGTEYEVIVVDNDSKDGSYQTLLKLENNNTHVYCTDRNGGFGYGNNIGVTKSNGKYLFFLNSDTLLYSGVIWEMLKFLEDNPEYGALSCLMEDGNGLPLVVGHRFESFKTLFLQTIVKPLTPAFIQNMRARKEHSSCNSVKEYDWVSGAALLIARQVFDKSGGWNEAFFMYMEDEELCFRIRELGYKVGVLHRIGLKHLVGKSGGSSFVCFEKYKSTKTFFRLINARHQRLIHLLIYIQSYFYMKGTERKTKINVIKRLIKV